MKCRTVQQMVKFMMAEKVTRQTIKQLKEFYPWLSNRTASIFLVKKAVTLTKDKVEIDLAQAREIILKSKLYKFEPKEGKQKLEVVFESNNILAVNKPARTDVFNFTENDESLNSQVANWLLQSEAHIFDEPSPIHRLDKDTSGLILYALNPETLSKYSAFFRRRQLDKTYLAVVAEEPAQANIQISNFISERTGKKNRHYVTAPGHGKPAETEIKFLKQNSLGYLLEVHPKTGRTHQIRVHLHSLENPILGDYLYGGIDADRMMLHALKIFIPETKEEFYAPAPAEFGYERSK